MLMWTAFANAVTGAANSVVASQNMVTKIYFPRMLIPLGAIGAVVVDLLVGSVMLALLMLGYALTDHRITIGWQIIYIAPFLVLALGMAATGLGTLLSALTVAYRDFRHVVPFLMQLWMFATPSIFVQGGTSSGLAGRSRCAEPGSRADREFPAGGAEPTVRAGGAGHEPVHQPGPAAIWLPVLPPRGAAVRGHHLRSAECGVRSAE